MLFDRIYSMLLSIEDISTVLNSGDGEIEILIKPENRMKWAYFNEKVEDEIPMLGIVVEEAKLRYLFPLDRHQKELAIKKFEEILEKKYYLIEKPPAVTLTIICKVTNLCNLDCKYCYDRPFRDKLGHNRNLTLEELDKLLDMATRHAEEVDWIFHGGEPTLVGADYYRKFFSDIVPKYPYAKFDFAIQTNGTLLDREWFELSKETGLNIGSSYSAKSEDHRHTKNDNESVKKGENIFDVIPKLKQAKEMDLDIGVIDVVTKSNMPDMIGRYEFYKAEKIDVAFNNVEETGEAENFSFIFKTGKEKRFYLESATEYFTYWLNDKDENCINERYAAMYAQLLLTGECGTCNFGCECQTRWIGVNSNGDIYPCDRPLGEKYRIGNLNDFTSFVEVFATEKYKRFIDERYHKKQNYCSKCFVRSYCKSGCPLVDIDKHDSAAFPNRYSCTMMKLNLTAMYRALMNTDIESCNNFMKEFITANTCVLPKEIPEVLKKMGLDNCFPNLQWDSSSGKLNSTEFQLFRAFNTPDAENRLTGEVYEIGKCEEEAEAMGSEDRLSRVVELFEEKYKDIIRDF